MLVVFHGLLISLYISYSGCNGQAFYTLRTGKKTGKSGMGSTHIKSVMLQRMILAIPDAQLLCVIEELQFPICFGILWQPIQLPCNRFVCATCLIHAWSMLLHVFTSGMCTH